VNHVAVGPQLSFRVGAAVLALPMQVVREVLTVPAVIPVPGSRSHVVGVALHRGLAVPVYDLRRLDALWPEPPGTEANAGYGAHLIVCAWGEAVVGVLGTDANLLEEARGEGEAGDGPTPVSRDYLSCVFESAAEGSNDMIACLDPSRLFPSLGVPLVEAGSAQEVTGEDDPAGR